MQNQGLITLGLDTTPVVWAGLCPVDSKADSGKLAEFEDWKGDRGELLGFVLSVATPLPRPPAN